MTLKIAMRIDVDADEAEKRVRDFKASIADIGKAAPADGAAAAIDQIGDAAQAAAADTAKLTTAEQAAGAAAAAMARQAATAANDAGTLGQRSGAAGRDVAELAAAARAMSAAAAAMALQAASGAAGVRQLGAAAQQATGEVAGLERQAANSNSAVSVLTGSLGGLRGMLAALGIGVTVQQLTQMADGWTIVGNRLRLVAANENDVTRLRLAVFGLAQDTRSALGSTAELFSGISRAAATLKVSEGSILAVTRTINQGFRVSGGSQASADAAVMQLLQGLSSGVLRGEEFNSVMEQAPRLAQALADALGKTRGELRAMAEQGQLTAETVVKALLSQAEAIDAEYQRMQATIGEGWTVMLNGAERWVGQAAAATGAAALLANTLVALGGNFELVGAAVAGLAAVGLVRLATSMRSSIADAAARRAAVLAQSQAEVAAAQAAYQHAAADLAAARAAVQRRAAIGVSVEALAQLRAADLAAATAAEANAAATSANAAAQERASMAARARGLASSALTFVGGVPGIVATAAVIGVTLLATAQDAGERSAQSYSRAMELAARSLDYVPQAAEAASGAVKQLGTDMLASTQAAARRSAEDATAAIDAIQARISGAAGRATVSAGGSLLDRLFGNDAGLEFTKLADEVEKSTPRTVAELDGVIDRLNGVRERAQALGAGGVVTRIDTFTKALLDQRTVLAEEENRLANANRVLAETERRQQAAAREAQGFNQALREQRDMMNRYTGNDGAGVRRDIAAAAAPQVTAARGAAAALDSAGLAGLSRFRVEQQLAAQAAKDAEKIFKDYQAAQGVTGEKALSLAEGLKSQNAQLRLAAQAAQEAGRATAELNAETERRERLAKLDQDNRDLQVALLAWRALPNGVRDYARAVEEATVSSRAAAMARDIGRGDDPAAIEAITAKLRQRLDLERQIKEEQDKQALAARIHDTATGGLSGYNRELELAAKLLAEGRISQEEFSAAASRISVEGFEAYRKAVKDGNTELAAAIKAQIEAQAKIAWGAMQAKAALDDVISRALDAMISLTQAGSQAGGILGWVAGMANGVLTRARQAQGEPETVPSWDEYWKGVQGQWSTWSQGHGGSGGSKKESDFDKESKRLKDQIRDVQLQADTIGLSSEAAARLTAQRRLLTAAEQDGRKVTAELTAEIDKQADSYAKASEAQRQAQIAQRQRETLAGNTVSLVGSTARPAEARSRELADLSRMGRLIQGGDPTMLDKLAESGYSVADALEAIRRRTLELQNPGLSGFLDGFKTSFRELATTIVKGGADASNALQSFLDSLYSLALDKFAFEPLGEAADALFDDIARGAGLGRSPGPTQPANDNPSGGGIGGLLGGLASSLFGGAANDNAAAASISIGTASITVGSGLPGIGGGANGDLLGGIAQAATDTKMAADQFNQNFGSGLNSVTEGVEQQGSGFLSGLGGAFGSIVNGIGSFLGDIGGGIGDFLGSVGSWLGFAKGAAFVRGAVQPFAAGTVVTGPTYFPMAGGRTGLMGEAGPEAIMPLISGARGLAVRAANHNGQIVPLHLTRLSDGTLGVALPPAQPFAQGGVFGGYIPAPPPATVGGAAGAGGGQPAANVKVEVVRGDGVRADVQQDRGPDGEEIIRIVTRRVTQNFVQGMARGDSDEAQAIATRFALNRAMGNRS
ncbi:tape measure protein [Inquilinus limosus]|uniref:tape measure protein n=1 Tax=Inquilinus limosus TaxID=171674 RepID=UPI00042A6D80|nr:tape measure protein [Inquilinus limosus]